MAAGVILAGQVGCAVCLVAFCLAGCAWWNDRKNDRHRRSMEGSHRGAAMEIKRSRSSKPPIEVAQGADVAELVEIDTALAVHSSELPAKVSDLIEQHKRLAAIDPDKVTLVEVLEHDKTHTEVTNHFAIVSKLDLNRTAKLVI
jgi:hypothetical protein